MDAQYGPLSAEFYQLTKPLDADYPDVPYLVDGLRGIKGRILEVGAGTGRLLIPLIEAGYKVEALEPSRHMVRWLEKNLKDRKLKTRVHQATVEEYHATNAFAAIVISFGSFQLFETRDQALAALRNTYANLQKGGRLFIDIDVIRPEPHKSGVKIYGARIPTDDGGSILLEGARRWDFVEQHEHVHLRYEKWKGEKLVSTEIQEFALRWYGQWEFASLLREAGFREVEISYDHGGESHIDTAVFCYSAAK